MSMTEENSRMRGNEQGYEENGLFGVCRTSGHRPARPLDLPSRQGAADVTPSLDVTETRTGLRLCADLPGVPAEAIAIRFRDGVLTITGARHPEGTDATERVTRPIRERRFGNFHRQITLPEGVDPDRIVAEVGNGVLTVHVPKRPAEPNADLAG